eukprot:m.49899 g.49899  ORF g.49899 m.49899 type:complete len:326 (-) comp12511_c0_seq1:2602-3579(-)
MTTRPYAIIVIGVSSCGKSTIASLLASALGAIAGDADDFHPEENVAKMKASVPLTDSDRIPWLLNINKHIKKLASDGKSTVVACSALKKMYREILAADMKDSVLFVFLEGTYKVIYERMKKRKGHYMPTSLLQSQFDALEVPDCSQELCITVSIKHSPEEIVDDILHHRRLLDFLKAHGHQQRGDQGDNADDTLKAENDDLDISVDMLCSQCFATCHLKMSLEEHHETLRNQSAIDWKCEACTGKVPPEDGTGGREGTPTVICSTCGNKWKWFPSADQDDVRSVPIPMGSWICPSCEGPSPVDALNCHIPQQRTPNLSGATSQET